MRYTLVAATLLLIKFLLLTVSAAANTAEPSVSSGSKPWARNINLAGHVGGSVQAVAGNLPGDRAYVGMGPTLAAIDISNPLVLRRVGSLTLPDSVVDIAPSNTLLYVATGPSGLHIVDTRDPTSLHEVGHHPTTTERVVVHRGIAYLATGEGGMEILDLANPKEPSLIATLATSGITHDVAVAGQRAYLAEGAGGLRIVDVTDPKRPVEVGRHQAPSFAATRVTVIGEHAIVSDRPNAALHVLAVSDSARPRTVGLPLHMGPASATIAHGRRLYLGREGELQVLDLENPASPARISAIPMRGTATDLAIIGDRLAAANGPHGFRLFDIEEPAAPAALGGMPTLPSAVDVQVDGAYAYVGGFTSFGIVDLTDISHPAVVSSLPVSGLAVAKADHFVYLASSSALLTIDVSNPLQARIESTLPFPGRLDQIAIDGDRLYLGNTPTLSFPQAVLRIFDLRTPSLPQLVSTLDGLWTPWDIEPRGDLVFVADSVPGLKILDVANLSSPTVIGNFTMERSNLGVDVVGDRAYLCEDARGIRVLDISSPEVPRQIGMFETPGQARDIVIDRQWAYVAAWTHGLRVVDLSNLEQPREIAFYDTPNFAHDVELAHAHAFVPNGFAGLFIFEQPLVFADGFETADTSAWSNTIGTR